MSNIIWNESNDHKVSDKSKKYYNEHYSQLLGHTITEIFFDATHDDIEPFPVLITKYKGKEYQVAVMRDPEGNGGGHLDIVNLEENKND